MNIKNNFTLNIKATNMELTSAIRNYVEKRMAKLEKLLERADRVVIDFEVGQTTKHHQKGDIFRAEVTADIEGKIYRASTTEEDLYVAIDKVEQMIFRDIRKSSNRLKTLMVRGARSVKKRIKGIKPWSGNRGK